MAPTNGRSCVFFARGLCRNGDACAFTHEQDSTIRHHDNSLPVTSSIVNQSSLAPARTSPSNGATNSPPVCSFYQKGWCSRGDTCYYLHPLPSAPPQLASSNSTSRQAPLQHLPESSRREGQDSRATIVCAFFSSARGCRNDSCPYLHAVDGREVENDGAQELETVDNEDPENDDNLTRTLSGAVVTFDEAGHGVKVSLPTDFSLACISGLRPGTSPETVLEILRGCGYNISIDCVRILGRTASSETKALVKVEDSSFAQGLSMKLTSHESGLSAVPLPIDPRKSNCRKVHVSWHMATRSVWLNYGNGNIAKKVAQKFNDSSYKILGRAVKCSSAKHSPGRGRSGYSYNSVAWTITLSDVPGSANVRDIEFAITTSSDRPAHVEMGSLSYRAPEPEVSVEVRRRLEEYGPLESFYLSPMPKGKRAKVAAVFQSEADAWSARSLNGESLPILGRGKVTVSLVQSAKIKLPTTIYLLSKSKIEQEARKFREQHLTLRVYPSTSQIFTTLKIEGDNPKELARACRKLDEISDGTILCSGQNPIWAAALSTNGNAYKQLKAIEKDCGVIIYRNKLKRHLQYYGSPDKLDQVTTRMTTILEQEYRTSHEIDLNHDQFARMIRGGFKSIQQALGETSAAFNVVSKKVTVSGTHEQYEKALAIVKDEIEIEYDPQQSDPDSSQAGCPICLCDAENALQTSCKHVYCLGCLEDYCKSAASLSKNGFQVKCEGDAGDCPVIFTLRDLREWLQSSVFEVVLKSCFDSYVQSHPDIFRYCPTPDCGHIYRTTPQKKGITYNCPNCFEPTCTSCHARHGDYTCEEYKDIASGGYEALKKLKKELNIKDCPKCSTPMEKTEGCNHMTCGGCQAHICWVCMATFEASGPCYAHMTERHGGIGIGMGDPLYD